MNTCCVALYLRLDHLDGQSLRLQVFNGLRTHTFYRFEKIRISSEMAITTFPGPPGSQSPNSTAQDAFSLDEAAIDKFSTLFSPATPRASPTLVPVPTSTMYAKRPRSLNYHQEASGSDSEFGSFVSVSAMEDPLSLIDFELPPSHAGSSSTEESSKGSNTQNSSLSFFDKFAQDAKEAVDRKKHGVLDELLMHEDDPLYFLNTPDRGDESGSNTAILPTSRPKIPSSSRSEASYETTPDSSNSLHDLDLDFFTSKPATSTLNQPRPHHEPTRSPTLTLPRTLAPPLADTSSASSSSSPYESSDPLSNNQTSDIGRPSSEPRSASYSTLTNISSRWMSSLLPSAKPTPATMTPSLESLFAFDTSQTPQRRTKNKPRARSIDRTAPSAQLHRTSTHPSADIQISHGTPFGSSLKVSPFASHTYTPPSGAPGFMGERYDWDKGYSDELERELGSEDTKERELIGIASAVNGTGQGVGRLMEKKNGSVDLLGRKASTIPVLSAALADMIRPHFPALARLPRKWTLFYSLDQDGISLKTLYSRCEAKMQSKPGVPGPIGALVVVKDAADGLFGVWMGKEGVHPSGGKGYYGSGECFLWKYIGGRFQVFKWTGKNDYVALCEPGFISFGGGDGNYGLYLDDTLYEGSSAACPTFSNEPLCSPGPKNAGVVAFECVGLEVWGVGP